MTEAIIDAASEMFSQLPWEAVTLRGIATRAGVNYGLVHRHFGTRADVVRAVFERAARDNSVAVSDLDLPAALETIFTRSRSGMGRVIASALVAGESPSSLHESFPTLHHIAEISARTETLSDWADPLGVDPRVFSGVLLACALGWWIFEPFLVAGLGLEQIGEDELRHQVSVTLRGLASGDGPDRSRGR